MVLLSKLAAGTLVIMIGIPSVSAKIWPDDFINPTRDQTTWSHDAPTGAMAKDVWANPAPLSPSASARTFVAVASDTTPLFFPSDIPNGPLTRGEFIDAISSRLYNTDLQGECLAGLGTSGAADYDLLFRDLSINQPLAISVCVSMKNGLVRGPGNNMLRPDSLITAAEVAAVFSRLSVAIRNPNGNEPWFTRYMETMSKIDPNFTLQPGDAVTGAQLRRMLCTLKRTTPQLDPENEFNAC